MKKVEITSPRTQLGAIMRLLRARKKRVSVEALPEICYVAPSVVLDDGCLKKYRALCGFKESQGVPFIFPQIMAFSLMMEFLGSQYCPWSALGMVHLANRIEQYEPLHVGDNLRVELRTGDLISHEKGQVFNIKFQLFRENQLVWQAIQSMLCRGISQPLGESYKSILDSDFVLSRQAVFSAPRNIGRHYGKVSGDLNPIHLSSLTAKAFGFKRAIAHGMWSKARALSALLPNEQVVEATSVVEFKRPMYLPGVASLWTNRRDQSAEFELRDSKGEELHLRGQLSYS